jgi:hypothetical protein
MIKETYKIYKPLRNKLRKVSVMESLYVFSSYLKKFQFGIDIPKNISYSKETIDKEMPTRGVYEWELTVLCKEVILNGCDDIFAIKKMNDWNYFTSSINILKNFENNLEYNRENFQSYLRCLSHRQFPWQTKHGLDKIIRYYKIYNNPRLAKIIEQNLGVNLKSWYLVGLSLVGAFLDYHKVKIDPDIQVTGINKKHYDLVINRICLELSGIRKIIKKEFEEKDNHIYSFNPLEFYPIIKYADFMYCPVVNFLITRITSGIYFEINQKEYKDFPEAFGFSFQDYVSDITKKIANNELIIHNEHKYNVGKKQKDSVDLIIEKNKSVLFVEVKTKRLISESKTEINSDKYILEDLEVMANNIVKMYSTLNDFTNNHYINISCSEGMLIIPVIVTMEDWYLIGEDLVVLNKLVRNKLTQKGIEELLMDKYPFSICSIKAYEFLIQAINTIDISEIYENWIKAKQLGHNFENHIFTQYKNQIHFKSLEHYFPRELSEIHPNLT